MDIEIIYEDKDVLAVNKPGGLIVAPEDENPNGDTLISLLTDRFPYLKQTGIEPRYGLVHRLDKDTSGILVIAKNNEALLFFQKQFKNHSVVKKYIALVAGNLTQDTGVIETMIGRAPNDRRKQKAYLSMEPGIDGKRMAVTEYKVLERFKDFTLMEVSPRTGRKHQIRSHMVYINHPIAGDKLYVFKNQKLPAGLSRHFLHAGYLKIKLPDGSEKEFTAKPPEDLESILSKLRTE